MTIGWYPGHMNKARKDITKAIQSVDAVIEIVDARIPYSSENPLISTIIGLTPRLKILNKSDLADPVATKQWLKYYQEHKVECVALDSKQITKVQDLVKHCYKKFKKPEKRLFKIMILGIPNVGKSTIINVILDRKIAKTGNEPAVTKARQEIRLSDNIFLLDTPGILWPKIEDQNSAYRLAATGAIKNTAIEFEDIALFTVAFLRESYADYFLQRYPVKVTLTDPGEILEEIARLRGCLRKGGVDYTKVSELFLNDFRSGKIGRVSLETPDSL